MPVNKENIRAWVNALRSGEFTQGTAYLTNHDQSHCCLGVACVVAGLTRVGLNSFVDEAGDSSATSLPLEARLWLGVDTAYPMVSDRGGQRAFLATLNDDGRHTFSDIADLIEQEWLSEEVADGS